MAITPNKHDHESERLGRLRRWLPDAERLTRSRWLRWFGPQLRRPYLWRVSRRGVALGAAIGTFFGLLIPLAQIPLSAGLAVALRAHLPSTLVSTLVSNPVTFAPLYYLAYRIGAALLGDITVAAADLPIETELDPQAEPIQDAGNAASSARTAIAELGRPLLLGLVILSCSGAALVYAVVDVGWRMLEWRARQVRTPHAAPGSGASARDTDRLETRLPTD